MEKKRAKSRKNEKSSKGKMSKRQKRDSEDEGFEEVSHEAALAGDAITFQDEAADMGMDSDTELKDTRKLVQQQNRKNKKAGGFQAMGLSHGVYKGVFNKGYKLPTPIQRKTIPLIMEGKDVVAMARTGSGKTAAFLIPMFERLKAHSAQSGCRAIILSPTRELAVQTLKFTKEIGKYTGLKAAVILGGDSVEDQFAALHENPDIIIATPGRFMHVLVEMELKLSSIEYIVFDEADRLFEMGFQEQLDEILSRVPENRQTLLFSATLPKLLVEFAKAGLHDPTLVRLDVDTKLSEHLQLAYLWVRHEDRIAALLHLLRNVVKPSEQTVLFVATKHHVEYLNMVLQEAGMTCSYSYSSLDATARKIQVAKFRNGTTKVLIVTDLAARGIDIPMLDNVINFNFPAKPKLFVHRVGRVARAGRSGMAYSLVSTDEMPYVLDLHLFLGRPFNLVTSSTQKERDGMIGRVPQSVLDDEDEHLRVWNQKTDLLNMRKVVENAYKHYLRSRPAPSSESVKRYKATHTTSLGFHPLFTKSAAFAPDLEAGKEDLMERMRNYKPQSTIFEIHGTKKGTAAGIMRQKRDYHGNKIIQYQEKRKTGQKKEEETPTQNSQSTAYTPSTEEDIQLAYLWVRHEDRIAALLHLLRNVVKPSEQTVLFVATKHHVEYLNMVLQEAGMTCSYSYSSLDATARKIQVAKFRNGTTKVLIVTDLAARGIDIPMLDNVINFNFPAKPKLFVHRVGRVARAGRSGMAYSLVSTDEMPYVLDLHLFLGRPFNLVTSSTQKERDGMIGRVPQSVLDDEDEHLRVWNQKTDLLNMRKVVENAYKHYLRSRPAPSSESVKRYKATHTTSLGFHPLFTKSAAFAPDLEAGKEDLMERMRNYKPQSTIFEIHGTKKGTAAGIMRQKRDYHGNKIIQYQEKRKTGQKKEEETPTQNSQSTAYTPSTEEDIQEAFTRVIAPKQEILRESKKDRRKKLKMKIKDEENYLSHQPKDSSSEKYYSLGTSFDLEAANLTLDLAGDDNQKSRTMNNAKKWDRKKKKFVQVDNNEGKNKKVRTESGRLIKASYKSNLYKDWLERSKMKTQQSMGGNDSGSDDDDAPVKKKAKQSPKEGRFQVVGEGPKRGRGFHQTKPKPEQGNQKGSRPRRRELRSKDQILKDRRKKSKLQNFQKYRSHKRQQRKDNTQHLKKRRQK